MNKLQIIEQLFADYCDLTDAKRYFSKTSCPAHQIANKYLNGVANRQDYLQTALRWIANRDGKVIEEYKPKVKEVVIPIPKRKVRKRRLFAFLDEEDD